MLVDDGDYDRILEDTVRQLENLKRECLMCSRVCSNHRNGRTPTVGLKARYSHICMTIAIDISLVDMLAYIRQNEEHPAFL